MEVRLTADQKALVRRAIQAGRFGRAEDAVKEALSLWEERERRRAEFLATLDAARSSALSGNGRPITKQSLRGLVQGIKERGRARLAANKSPR